jgi:hypothetical protein
VDLRWDKRSGIRGFPTLQGSTRFDVGDSALARHGRLNDRKARSSLASAQSCDGLAPIASA